jgi:hypothetical protein
MSKQEPFRIAVLDDYQDVALSLADWSVLDARATVTVFNDHLTDFDAVVERLQPFEIVCVMRERTPMTRTIIERYDQPCELPKACLDPRPDDGRSATPSVVGPQVQNLACRTCNGRLHLVHQKNCNVPLCR